MFPRRFRRRLTPYLLTPCLVLGGLATVAFAQNTVIDVDAIVGDLTIVEREEAAAKEIRLKWITEERTRIRYELEKHKEELKELQELTPDPVKPRDLSDREERNRKRDEVAFNDWATNNTPERRLGMVRGSGINALLKVLGPIAHCRKQRAGGTTAPSKSFPSLDSSNAITADEVTHYRINPATSGGKGVEFRINKLPLDIEWPTLLSDEWEKDCNTIKRLRDDYVGLLLSTDAAKGKLRRERWEDLDNGCALLQVNLVIAKSRAVSIPVVGKRVERILELQEGIRYLEQFRASAKRFLNAPAEFRMRSFPGGSVEDFIDFCYMHNMLFQPARPEDEEAYVALSRRMQDYARDIQYVEDWKADVEARIEELQGTDKELVWRASAQ